MAALLAMNSKNSSIDLVGYEWAPNLLMYSLALTLSFSADVTHTPTSFLGFSLLDEGWVLRGGQTLLEGHQDRQTHESQVEVVASQVVICSADLQQQNSEISSGFDRSVTVIILVVLQVDGSMVQFWFYLQTLSLSMFLFR